MKVLLTGAGGFIGSHVLDALLAHDFEVRAFFHYNGRNESGMVSETVLRKCTPIYGDLMDESAVNKAVEGMDAVMHMGAIISIPFSYDNPVLTTQVNVTGTLNILQACRQHKVKRVVVTSTSEVYGSADPLPITELHPLRPQSPYSASKVGADALAWAFYCSYGLPVIILRPFNTFGPRQSDRAIIPTIICQALSSKDCIEVGALHPKRDFVYAEDTADAFLKAVIAPNEVNGETIHIGTNKSYSVQGIITIVQDQLGTNKPIKVVGYRSRPNQSEVLHLLADYSKAMRLLNWSPTVTFGEGIQRVIEYVKENPEKFDANRYAK